MKKKLNKMKLTILGSIALLLLTAIIVVTGISMYTTYTSDKQIITTTEFCKEKSGYLKISTSNNYIVNVKVSTKDTAQKLIKMAGPESIAKSTSCSPTGSSYIKLPNGNTLLRTSDSEVQ